MFGLVNAGSFNDSFKCNDCIDSKKLDNQEPCNSCIWDDVNKRGKEWRGK